MAKAEPRGEEEDDGSDLAGNADHILAGGSMSILRRKGKQFKDKRGKDREGGRGGQMNYELLSSDILTLLQVYKEEATDGMTNVSDTPKLRQTCTLSVL